MNHAKYEMKYKIQNTKYGLQMKKGFTLIELLIVIAIIGILAGVVLVNTRSGVEKARRASALTTASSVLTELATCADDGGFVKTGDIAVGGGVCCQSATVSPCTLVAGHTVTWPDISGVGWGYKSGGTSGNLDTSDYKFTISKTAGGETDIVCNYANSVCQ